jgi:CBS domain containing-hemolysin-like protein
MSSIFRGRRMEHSLRRSIEELMQEPGTPPVEDGGDERPELDRQERALIGNVLGLRGTTVDDVMIPRADIVAMAEGVTLDEALEIVRREGHSRMPIFRDHLDDIVGMVHVKDLFAFIGRPQAFSIAAILREPLLVAPQVPVLDLLLQMRNVRTHLALVVDEYGGIDGLVSFEDLVETIVGDIADEHDEPDGEMLVKRPDGTLDIDARLPVDEFEEGVGPVLTAEERASEIETVGGLVFTLAGRVPARGEVIGHPSGIEFRVMDSDPRHIRRLRASLPVPAGT